MPELDQLREIYEPQGVKFLALSLEPDLQANAAFALRLGLSMTVAQVEGEVLGPFSVNAVPSVVLVGKDGRIKMAVSGARKKKFFDKLLEELVGG